MQMHFRKLKNFREKTATIYIYAVAYIFFANIWRMLAWS